MAQRTTREEAIQIAKEYKLEAEVKRLMDAGFEPWQALWEWDLPLDINEFKNIQDDYKANRG